MKLGKPVIIKYKMRLEEVKYILQKQEKNERNKTIKKNAKMLKVKIKCQSNAKLNKMLKVNKQKVKIKRN